MNPILQRVAESLEDQKEDLKFGYPNGSLEGAAGRVAALLYFILPPISEKLKTEIKQSVYIGPR